jgi:predicted metal-dependent hydrolase
MTDIKYSIIYSRRRSIGISVKPDSTVTVHAPFRTPQIRIEQLIHSKSDWINKHLKNFKSSVRINNNHPIRSGSQVLLNGKKYHINIFHSARTGIIIKDESIQINLKDPTDDCIAGRVLEKWIKERAAIVFHDRFYSILEKYKAYNFKPTELRVRALKRRWGSCTTKGCITLSSELIKLDDIFLEYVILHELCHLKHHNHGKEFYLLLTEVFPEWKKVRNELKKYVR